MPLSSATVLNFSEHSFGPRRVTTSLHQISINIWLVPVLTNSAQFTFHFYQLFFYDDLCAMSLLALSSEDNTSVIRALLIVTWADFASDAYSNLPVHFFNHVLGTARRAMQKVSYITIKLYTYS